MPFQCDPQISLPAPHQSETAMQATTPVTLTPKAISVVKQEMAKANLSGYSLRVAVVGGGCSGYQYDLDFSNEVRSGDIVSDQDGLRVVVDERSSLYLQGTTIDYVDSFGTAGFKFVNPNAQKTCGCGSSFTA